MLSIRHEQVLIFKEQSTNHFRVKMLRYLKEKYGHLYSNNSDQEILEVVDKGIKKAFFYNIKTQSDVAMFIDRMALYGISFDKDVEYSWIQRILNSKTIPSEYKMYEIQLVEKDSQIYGSKQ